MWQGDGNKMSIPKTNIKGILVPTKYCISLLERKGSTAFTEIGEELRPLLLKYQRLTYKTLNDYFEDNPGTGPSHMLDVMECFHHITPMARSLGEITFTCLCDDGFRCIACCHTTLFSALWDPKVRVPKNHLITVLSKLVAKKTPTAFADKCTVPKAMAAPRATWHSVASNGDCYS
jgi:hypothetical protein